MQAEWSEDTPIYKQLRERIVALILEGELTPGDALPSVRQVAADYRINPLTVTKAYQELSEENIVEKRRGLGLYVNEGAKEKLSGQLRHQFLSEEWPKILQRIELLGLTVEDLLAHSHGQGGRA
ncbi:GntR family transcriptional regulator [Permianibacter aggregans]|uniref:GntR family transcriptional regulator n=1 Tax=Permianibacter aggregans TaxID=1510150 RepID=A0A4R6UTV1_9GAMM|nr:GntR family transcriptional regulator [Permianibacter aggregans]QGX38778.1 GntR family transcriptional regulator [Permianibacter aggregans]TDQ50582.1 GntR family transcriptional regulator [Permianibacter aggregans]